MTVEIVISKRARLNLGAISDWWNREVGTTLFSDELSRAWKLLEAVPGVGPPYRKGPGAHVRRLLLPRSQYYVYYEYLPGSPTLTVITVWSTRRGHGPDLSTIE